MPEKKIYILTGPVRTGKTTKLLQWAAGRKDVFGILTPDIEGKKVFMDAHTKEEFEMETKRGDEDPLVIGRFLFSKKSFAKAIEILREGLKEKSGWLIVDEIGPLELSGVGFYEVINEIVKVRTGLKILFVIRGPVLDKAIQFFGLDRLGPFVIDINADVFEK
jgi:nucleoside-triphosphatase THEP1